jgi:hypothetical protein
VCVVNIRVSASLLGNSWYHKRVHKLQVFISTTSRLKFMAKLVAGSHTVGVSTKECGKICHRVTKNKLGDHIGLFKNMKYEIISWRINWRFECDTLISFSIRLICITWGYHGLTGLIHGFGKVSGRRSHSRMSVFGGHGGVCERQC